MRPDDYHSFLAMHEQAGDLARVSCPVDPNLEIAAIVDRVCKGRDGGKALLFEKVKGSSLPLAANLFGSPQRMQRGLGVEGIGPLVERLRADLAATGEESSAEALVKLVNNPDTVSSLDGDAAWRTAASGEAALQTLPAVKSWPGDGGRYLTLGQVFTQHPDTRVMNCGLYRVQLMDGHKALLRCYPGSGGAQHLQAWHGRGLAMPVAIALGGPPALTWAASVSLPDGVTEPDYAGYLTGRPIAMAECPGTDLSVPATADIVITGRVFPNEELPEGPFGNHSGQYVPPTLAPVIRIDSVARRPDALYPCTIVGPPPMETVQFGRLTGQLLLPLLQHDHPWVSDLFMPDRGLFHKAAFVAIRDECTLEGDALREALLSSLLLRGSRLTVLLNEGVAITDLEVVYWQMLNRGRCNKRAEAIWIDARMPAGSEAVASSEEVLRTVAARWTEYGL